MALTQAEKSQRWRERQKAQKEAAERLAQEKFDALFSSSFHEFFNDHGDLSTFDIAFDLMGVPAPQFKDNADPVSRSGEDQIEGGYGDEEAPYRGSLGRAELMMECLKDATVTLSGIINQYKREQITARLNEIEQADLADPATRKAGMDEVVRLNKLLEQLSKPVRWNFPQWKLKAE